MYLQLSIDLKNSVLNGHLQVKISNGLITWSVPNAEENHIMRTSINRITGTITMESDYLGNAASGQCSSADKAKF